MSYSPREIEQKWQAKWKESGAFETDLDNAKNPFFTHVMFPYPSGDRLHIGHWYNYAPADSYARYKRLQGYDVYEPMGFDAFGLPAENYAIKTGVHPNESIRDNISNMIEQLSDMGCMYDWDNGVTTCDPDYYRWTQWVFLELYKNDLIYKKDAEVNWDPVDQTVLANEQVMPDGTAERSGAVVEKRKMPQWFARVTNYADELLEGAENLDWPKKTKIMQENWIGRKEGMFFKSRIKDFDYEFEVWDSVPQTFMAQTFTVIAPDHPILPELMKGRPEEKEVMDFAKKIINKKINRKFDPNEDLEGIFTGHYVDNPYGTGDLPIWVASYVVLEYGTGIVHCSAHDERDFDFAKKYDIPLRVVMLPEDEEEAQKVANQEYCFAKAEEGIMQLPEKFKGRKWGEVRNDIEDYLIDDMKIGRRDVNYRLRDWCISRQRYWGAPIPIVYDPDGNPHPIPEEHLPWTLPTDVEFKPTGTSPLADSKEFKERTESIFGKGWEPEVDTMDTFVCSSFYSYRYLAHGDESSFVPAQREKDWMSVDFYCGGAEHSCLHLIYARFVTKALADMGYVSHGEPFQKLVHQGMITKDGAKMSKSKGNVVPPDPFVEKYGSDVFRMYLMFMGPFTEGGDWNDTGINGTDRFAKRIFTLIEEKHDASLDGDDMRVLKALHKSIKKVGEDIEKLHFNTALASLMETLNALIKEDKVSTNTLKKFVILLSPMAPHLAEELWENLGQEGFVIDQSWPECDMIYLQESTVTIAIQINGKLRGTYEFANGVTKEEVIETVYDEPNIQKWMEGKSIVKEIFIPGKILNIVVK